MTDLPQPAFLVAQPMLVERCRQWVITPAKLLLNDVDLDITAALAATSPFIDLRGHFNYKLIVNVTASGMTLGAFKITLEEFDAADVVANGVDATVIDSEDLITVIDTTQNAQKEILLFGATFAPTLFSSGGGTDGTIGNDLDKYKLLFVARLKLEVTTTGSGTSATADVTLLAGD